MTNIICARGSVWSSLEFRKRSNDTHFRFGFIHLLSN